MLGKNHCECSGVNQRQMKKGKIYIYTDREIKAEKGAAAHRLRPIRLVLVAIAIGDKDFIVSPVNRKTDERALRKEKRKKNQQRKKNQNGVTTKRPVLNARMRIFRRVCVHADAKNAQPAK